MSHEIYMAVAETLAGLSKCRSKQVAVIAVRDNNILAVGVNGSLPGTLNCSEKFEVVSIENREEHHSWSLVNELHAEQNLLAKASRDGTSLEGAVAYITLRPCSLCFRMLVASGIKQIFYRHEYDKSTEDFSKIAGFVELIKL